MFGIGKDKETETDMDKVEKKRDEDEIPFDFEEEDKLPFDDDDGFAEEEIAEDEADRRTVSSRSIILLVIFLLLAFGGGGYYYLMSTPAPLVQPAAPVTVRVKVQPEAPAPVSVVAAPAAPVLPGTVVMTPVERSPVAAPAVVPATSQPFTLVVGAFLGQNHQRAVEKKIRRLGYIPKVQTTYSMVPMTRLLLGVYDPAAAATRRTELAAQIPELFTLKQGDKVALYAGSFQSLNTARSSADQLYLRGIHVDEETVSLRMPLKKVSYGSFATRAAAETAAKKAAAAGLKTQVIKR